jgi:hypothetical protein
MAHPPEAKGELILSNPEKWSPEASNFLYVTSWGTLKDIESVRKSCPTLSRTVLINLIEQVCKRCIGDGFNYRTRAGSIEKVGIRRKTNLGPRFALYLVTTISTLIIYSTFQAIGRDKRNPRQVPKWPTLR